MAKSNKLLPSVIGHFACLWFISSLLSGYANAALNSSNTGGPFNALAEVTLTINEISSPYSIETLTSISPDQCKLWGDSGSIPPLTWELEARLLLFSVTNLYEVYDFTRAPSSSSSAQLRYSPAYLSFNRVGFSDPSGLGFYLSLNATPYCGNNFFPKKTLCNEGIAVPINRTMTPGGSGSVVSSLSMCGQRFTFSYGYTYACSNTQVFPPSCKTACYPVRNSTHCFTCDEHDGSRLCCPGSSPPECRMTSGDPALHVPEASLTTGAIVAIVCLSLFCVFLLVVCIVVARLLVLERKRQPVLVEPISPYTSNGDWNSNGYPKKNGTVRRASSSPLRSETLPEQPVFVVSKHLKSSDSEPDDSPTLVVAPVVPPRSSRKRHHEHPRKHHEHPADIPEQTYVIPPDVETIPKERVSDELYSKVDRQRSKSGTPNRRTPVEHYPGTPSGVRRADERKKSANGLGTLF